MNRNPSIPRPGAARRRPVRCLLRGLAATFALLIASAPLAPASGRRAAGGPPDRIARAQRLLEQADARAALAVLREAEAACRAEGPAARARLAPVLRLQGYVLVLLRRDAEAEAVFRGVLGLDSSDAYARLELAKRLHARGAFAEARRHYERLLARDPDSADVREHLERLARAERSHADVAAKIAAGERVVVRLGVLTAVLLVGFGILLRFLLFRRVGARE